MINIGANSVLSVSPNGAISCVTKGEGKDLPPDAAFWGRQFEVRMLYQQILILTIYKVSNSSGSYPIAKFHQDQQGCNASSYEPQ